MKSIRVGTRRMSLLFAVIAVSSLMQCRRTAEAFVSPQTAANHRASVTYQSPISIEHTCFRAAFLASDAQQTEGEGASSENNRHESLRDTFRSVTGFSLTACRATWRAATGISLTTIYASTVAVTGLWIRKIMHAVLSVFPAWVSALFAVLCTYLVSGLRLAFILHDNLKQRSSHILRTFKFSSSDTFCSPF